MTGFLGPPLALGATVTTLAAIHARSVKTRVLVESLLLAALSGGFAWWGVSPLLSNVQVAGRHDELWLRALAVVWWLLGARFVATLISLALGRGGHAPRARLLSDLVAGAVYLTAALVVLNVVLGLQLKGLLATSGLIAILVGLASQNTLADVFSGIAVGLDHPFRIGDRVSVDEHAEGVVVGMNWRSIRVQTDGEDVALIPNSLVAKGLIINRSVPTPRRAASVDIPVLSPARSDVLMDLLRQAILLSPKVLSAPEPAVALKRLGVHSTTYGVSYFVASSPDLGPARAQLLRQVCRLFTHAGIGTDGAPSPAALLSRLAIFDTLTEAQIGRLEAELIPRRLETGALLFAQGEVGASIFIVRSGVLEVSRREGDTARPLGRVGPGEYLGDVSMMSGKPHPASAAALTPCVVLELPRSALEALLNSDAAVGEALELSVKRGMDRLDRDDAARAAQPLDENTSPFALITQFLRRRLA
jgi:small-conductance mechanosensitive channel/CRP-like cAMP-binding protein